MNSTTKEDVALQKRNYDSIPRGNGFDVRKTNFFRLKQRYCLPNQKPTSSSPVQKRFKKAFAKALSVRSRVLGRRLTRFEWCALKNAVAKQCSPQKQSLSVKVSQLSKRLEEVSQLIPVSLGQAADSVDLLRFQVSVLRQQALEFMIEKDSLSETCPHFRKRRIFLPPPIKEAIWFTYPGFQPFSYLPTGNPEQLCCPDCLSAREDAFFSWTGSCPQFSTSEAAETLVAGKKPSPLLAVSPLSIQSVWTQCITHRFRSHV